MPNSSLPSTAAAPGCIEARRRHRGRSHGSHVNCPSSAACKNTPSRDCRGSDSVGSLSTRPTRLEPSIRQALKRLYDQWKGPEKTLSASDLALFVKEEQKQNSAACLNQISAGGTYTFPEFCDFWYEHASRSKRPLELDKVDFSKPISNYYINSSHNTYIGEGDQVSGVISTEQYRKVIRGGCRCVEIDVWNSPRCNDPPRSPRSRPAQGHWSLDTFLSWMKNRVEHGGSAAKREPSRKPLARSWALSNRDWDEKLELEPRVCHCLPTIAGDLSARTGLAFRLVCRAVKDVAFEQTDLPLIISLEDHTTGDQHKEMVKIMREEWAGLLLESALPGCDPETHQPSVVDLKRKILIKGKRKSQQTGPSKLSNPGPSQRVMPSEMSAKEYYGSVPEEKHIRVNEEKMDYALNKLAIYTYSAGPFKSLNSKDSQKPAHIFSFSEEKLKGLHRTKHKDVFQHNKNYLARTFPASLRSANPNLPTLCWRKGVQMVSLNWQHWDTAMYLNDAMFDDTHGWVLKPEGYQSGSTATCQAHVTGKKKLSLRITIMGGQNIPMPRAIAGEDHVMKTSPSVSSTTVNGDPDMREGPATSEVHDTDFRPRVKCYLHVESQGERSPIMKLGEDEICRETKPAETQHPVWPENESTLQFPEVSHVVEQLSFLRFRVEDTGLIRIRDQCTSWACIRLDRLEEGYRLIELKDLGGCPTEGKLLVKVEKTVIDEPGRQLSLRAKTWNACKKGSEEVTRLGSRWSCFGQGAM
ncbi:hypothetical protein KVR01_005949 [Diaporthe batatas]|uniref:uncharacterized protein n=1 Tax=Diaporthe batatas TaxID=748121 RepID=UPI001D046880|nr:uncharacterized protein KVR01_005949 [Diaporthe batatas]KAG8164031.1 hypothetical protein KVR01_005949 [Diaporthe batatas]